MASATCFPLIGLPNFKLLDGVFAGLAVEAAETSGDFFSVGPAVEDQWASLDV